jgi:hypothetical protein
MTNADAYVVVYNVCSRQSFELLPTFFQEITEAKGDLKGPIMLIGAYGRDGKKKKKREREKKEEKNGLYMRGHTKTFEF